MTETRRCGSRSQSQSQVKSEPKTAQRKSHTIDIDLGPFAGPSITVNIIITHKYRPDNDRPNNDDINITSQSNIILTVKPTNNDITITIPQETTTATTTPQETTAATTTTTNNKKKKKNKANQNQNQDQTQSNPRPSPNTQRPREHHTREDMDDGYFPARCRCSDGYGCEEKMSSRTGIRTDTPPTPPTRTGVYTPARPYTPATTYTPMTPPSTPYPPSPKPTPTSTWVGHDRLSWRFSRFDRTRPAAAEESLRGRSVPQTRYSSDMRDSGVWCD
ncbi:hypothetical protein F5Y17DRAFT_428171 [Xylariaceae sp. FL0594]|nr:hypothetical protein F5Y17DRAFT_428171 [Xylariaceae sp. FL0594]